MSAVQPTRERRRGLVQAWKAAHEKAGEILFAEDPIGINYETNTREYDLEVGTILPRLRTCNSVAEVRVVLHEEFGHWFGAEMVGPSEKYQRIAERLWAEVMPSLRG